MLRRIAIEYFHLFTQYSLFHFNKIFSTNTANLNSISEINYLFSFYCYCQIFNFGFEIWQKFNIFFPPLKISINLILIRRTRIWDAKYDPLIYLDVINIWNFLKFVENSCLSHKFEMLRDIRILQTIVHSR